VPKKYGGAGADLLTYCILAAEIGRHCGSTALTYNMHVCSTLWTGALAEDLDMTPEQRAEHESYRTLHFQRIVEQGKLYAQPFSEGSAAAAGKAPFGTLATKVDGGWVVNGKKIFASLSGAADFYGTLCTEDKPDRSLRDTLYLAIPAEAEGFSIVGDWDPLGMRGTVSRTLVMKDVFVPDGAQLMPRGLYFQAASRWPHMFATLSPTYMGIAQAAYDFTVQYLRGEVPGTPPVKRRMYPTKQIAVAQMHIKLEQTKAIWFQAVTEAGPNPTKAQVLDLIEKADSNVVINGLALRVNERPDFFADLLPGLGSFRRRTARPHWLVIDEAHHLLPKRRDDTRTILSLELPGTVLITVHPEAISTDALRLVTAIIALGPKAKDVVKAYCSSQVIPSLIAFSIPAAASFRRCRVPRSSVKPSSVCSSVRYPKVSLSSPSF